jgi:hypothetical protein
MEQEAKKLFLSRENLLSSSLHNSKFSVKHKSKKNSFKCVIYYLIIQNIDTLPNSKHYPSKLRYLLTNSNVPLYDILDINYPYLKSNNSLNTVILYFTSLNRKENTQKKLLKYVKKFCHKYVIIT